MYNPTMNDASTQISGEGAEKLDMKLVSADSHIVEPPHCYIDHIDPEWRDRAPRIQRTESGADYFEVPGMPKKITLGLTALDLIRLPSTLVESIVALSVAIAGLQAWWVCRLARRQDAGESVPGIPGGAALPGWLVFSFGLVHGIGFGSALGGAGFGGRPALSALFGFNVGVEAGQLLVIAFVFPLAWALRGAIGFRRLLLPASAALIVLAGSSWFLLRVFGVDVIGALIVI